MNSGRHGRKVAPAPKTKCPLRIVRHLRGRIGGRGFRCNAHWRTIGAHALDKSRARITDCLRRRGSLLRRRLRVVDRGQVSRWDGVFLQHLIEHLPEHVFEPGLAHREYAVNNLDK
jgi:hypothetical protein